MLLPSPALSAFTPGTLSPARLLALLQHLAPRYAPPLDLQVPDLPAYAEKLAARAEIVLAHTADADLGLAAIYANDALTRLAFLSTLAVAAAHEGSGLAKQLLQRALALAAARGMTHLRLAVAVRQPRALEFYLRQGFAPLPAPPALSASPAVGPALLLERPCPPPPPDTAPVSTPAATAAPGSSHAPPTLPAFARPLHVGGPNLGDRTRFLTRVHDLLDRRWLTNGGPYVQEFERRIASLLGVRHCIALSNATVALEIACRALDLRGEVIIPAYTFAATAHAFQWLGVEPRFAEIDPTTHNLDPAHVAALITPRTSAIVGVHVWGRACAPEALTALGQRHGLPVIFDAAHAFGCTHGGRWIGGFGRCEVFSFHATKFLNSFEGGAITTDDDSLATRLRLLRNFGFTGVDRVSHLGINGKMTEICAAMGLTSLDAFDDLVALNQRNYAAYAAELAPLPGLRLLPYPASERNNYQYIVVEVDAATCPLDRDTLVARLHQENILARKYFWPGCHRMEPYCSRPDGIPHLPVTDLVARRVLLLPTGQAVTPTGIERIGAVLGRHLR